MHSYTAGVKSLFSRATKKNHCWKVCRNWLLNILVNVILLFVGSCFETLQLPPSGLCSFLCHLSLDDIVRDCLQCKQCGTSNVALHLYNTLNIQQVNTVDDYHIYNKKGSGPTYLMQHDEINNHT